MPFRDVEARRAYQRAYYRPRMAALYRRYRAVGGCGECGQPSGRFSRCLRHRLRLATRKRRARRVDAGG
jgi:hypothetical protein